jgi:hypothetical protein
VAFTPKPRLIELEMVREGNQRLVSGDLAREATRYALKPKLGAALRLFACVATGRCVSRDPSGESFASQT